MIYHKHLLINAKINKPLFDEDEAIAFLRYLVKEIDMKIIQGPFVTYLDVKGNRGMTGIVMIETSHIAFHIWDETAPSLLQFDLYTCGTLDKDKTLQIVQEQFKTEFLEYVLFDRENGFVIEAQG